MMRITLFQGLAGLLTLFTTLASSASLSHTLVHQFAKPTWLENIAVRANGELLLTEYSPQGILWRVTSSGPAGPASAASVDVVVAHNFTAAGLADGLLGIAETATDVFAVVGFTTSSSASGDTTWDLFSVDFNGGGIGPAASTSSPTVSLIANLPNAGLANGVAALPSNSSVALVADSTAGLVYRVDLDSGAVDVAASVPEMTAPSDAGLLTYLGVNGIKVSDGYLYWTRSDMATIYRVAIGTDGYVADGAAVETVADLSASTAFIDDFVISGANIFVTTNSNNQLMAVEISSGQSEVVAGSPQQLTVAGDTACAFGRGPAYEKYLFVTTNGALKAPVNGTVSEGGKVVAIDTTNFSF
ncbi:hypothetical protein GGR56DRAFT_662487 [Xylariaceae sp. FL0804]|nr:hypothetical protein GGR56DRAFT_662487 [Xylariaceae sp. FL0804]